MNNLFNQKILAKKAEEEVDLSKHNFSERRKALNKWINNLENGILDKSKEEELVEDLIQIITVFSCKLQGKRSKQTKKMISELKS